MSVLGGFYFISGLPRLAFAVIVTGLLAVTVLHYKFFFSPLLGSRMGSLQGHREQARTAVESCECRRHTGQSLRSQQHETGDRA